MKLKHWWNLMDKTTVLVKTTWHVANTEVLLLLLRTEEKTAHALTKCNPTTRCWEGIDHFLCVSKLWYCSTLISFEWIFLKRGYLFVRFSLMSLEILRYLVHFLTQVFYIIWSNFWFSNYKILNSFFYPLRM